MTFAPSKIKVKDEFSSEYEEKKKSGLGFDTVKMIKLYGESHELFKISTFIKNAFIVYKDRCSKYGDHEVHIWTSEDGKHIQITPNAQKNKEARNNEIVTIIRRELESSYRDSPITAIFLKGYQLSKELIEDFLLNYKLDMDNLQLEKFNVLRFSYVGFPKVSTEALNKYDEINSELLELLVDKKVILNGMKGKFKRHHEKIGFFKLRARSHYYSFEINYIKTLEHY